MLNPIVISYTPILTDTWLKKLFEFYLYECLFAPEVVRRSWWERLLSWPWRPWRKTKLDWSKWEREPGPCTDHVTIRKIPEVEMRGKEEV